MSASLSAQGAALVTDARHIGQRVTRLWFPIPPQVIRHACSYISIAFLSILNAVALASNIEFAGRRSKGSGNTSKTSRKRASCPARVSTSMASVDAAKDTSHQQHQRSSSCLPFDLLRLHLQSHHCRSYARRARPSHSSHAPMSALIDGQRHVQRHMQRIGHCIEARRACQ